MIRHLPWDTFDWDEFQRLCILIAEYKFPECDFQEYLRQGHKQYGTDLQSFDYRNAMLLNVQCKKVKKLSETDLKEIIDEFIQNELAAQSSHFILATNYDTNIPKLRKAIVRYQEELLRLYRIQFHCWGKIDLEKYLKNNWRIVYYYFGYEPAENFCYPQLRDSAFSNLLPIKNYIPRKIYRTDNHISDSFGWFLEPKQLEDLIDILTKNVIISQRICLVGDAYQGKSSYLKYTAFLLKNHNAKVQPLLIEIKDVNADPIEDILDKTFGQWKGIPLKDIVIFIDGLDEAPTDKFREMVKYIKQFSKATTSVNLVISCRKLFYDQLGVRDELQNFEVFELFKIQQQQINDYVKTTLKGKVPDFLSLVRKANVTSLLEHPFYLVNLVDEYNISAEIPDSKIGIIELFIDKAYQKSLQRQLPKGQIINDQSYQFRQVIARFALALQLAGANSFTYEEVQQIFENDEIGLLRHNSMIHISKNSWSFANAMFQEHFAALLLSKIPFDKIVEYAAVGKKFKKIRAKWVQTMSSLLSILPQDSPLFIEVLGLIKQDNIELLFQAEPSKFDAKFKETLLRTLIERCIKTNTRTTIIYENTIADFIDGINPAISYLIGCLKRKHISDHVKDICIRVLRSIRIPASFKDEIIKIVVNEIQCTSNPYFAGQLIQLLIGNKSGDRKLVNNLIKYFPDKHEYRDDVYELIIVLALQDIYYNYALEGFRYLIDYNKGISHHGSSRTLEELLLATNSRANFWKLFKAMQSEQWLQFYQHRSVTSEDFISRLFNKCIEIYKSDPLIILPIASYIVALGRQFLRSEFKEIDRFLEETNSHSIAVRLLIDKIFEENSWEIGALITSDSYDYILFEFEDKNRSLKSLRNCISGLRYKKKEEISNQFSQLCDEATEGKIFDKTHWGEHEENLKLEKRRKENDRKYIISAENFKQGVLNYFHAYGKKRISENELYVHEDERIERKQFDSTFIFRYLINWRRNRSHVYLKDCLKWLDNEKNFESFRAEEILNYTFDNDDDKIYYINILKEYYYAKLKIANFENCKWMTGDKYHWRTVELRLGEIFKKFEFPTSEDFLIQMIWLDEGGIRIFENNRMNNTESLAELVIKCLSNSGIQKLKDTILLNIIKGIKLQSVLGTHLALCRHFKIREAREDLLEIINNNKIYSQLNLGDVVDIYLEVGGDVTEIVKLVSNLKDYNEYWYFHLIKLIAHHYSGKAIKSLVKALQHPASTEDTRIESAKHLATLGELRGFKFLIQLIRVNKRSPYSIQGHLSIHKVDTILALKEIEDLTYLVVDKQYEDGHHFSETARNILIELLYGFAGKSEEDLKKVIVFCEKAKNNLITKGYDNATDFNFFINRMIENFRNSDKTTKSISELKSIIQNVIY